MVAKKPTDLKSVTLGQVKDLDSGTVVGGGAASESASTASKSARDLKKMQKTADSIDRHATPETGAAGGSASKKIDKDQAKRAADGIDDGPTGVPPGV